jgi:CheY-like chemotaxis protein
MFGSAIRSQRSELGISQEELADRAGLHRTYISDVERGARNLSLESIAKLARALELSVTTLFEKTELSEAPFQLLEILLVEDNPNDAELARLAFRKGRIANPLQVVRDGAEALEFLFATGHYRGRGDAPLPGIILLDLDLPKISGLEVLRSIRADQRTHNIPVVILTNSAHDQNITECRRLGVRGYIVKPVGFQNFNEVAPHLEMAWALVRPPPRQQSGAPG